MELNNNGEKKSFSLVPEFLEFEFNLDLEEWSHYTALYRNAFEINVNMKKFVDDDIKIEVHPKEGLITISTTNGGVKHNVLIPSEEKEIVLQNGLKCVRNSQGIMRFFATLDGEDISGEGDEENERRDGRWKMSSAIEDAANDEICPGPEIIEEEFEFDVKLIKSQGQPELKLTPKKTYEAFVNTAGIKNLRLTIINKGILRIQGESTSGRRKAFLREIRIPGALLIPDIFASINRNGILRFIGHTEDSRKQLVKVKPSVKVGKLELGMFGKLGNEPSPPSISRGKGKVGTSFQSFGQRTGGKVTLQK